MKQCPTCRIEFESNSKRKIFCSNVCLKRKTLNICVYCNKEFRSFGKAILCSRSCQTSRRNKTWTFKNACKKKFGDDWKQRYDEWRLKISKASFGENNPMYGRHHTKEACERIAKRTRGKTLIEIYGFDRAKEIHDRQSFALSGSKNPAYGKVYVNGGKSVKGYYKNRFFRSLLEYSFMKHFESKGLSLNDIDYECFIIPYVFEGRDRTYRIDFFDKTKNIAYEVKPSYVLKKLTPILEAKWNAARELLAHQGITFSVITEREFPKITFDVARQDPDVIWKEQTFKYFKNSK